MDFQVRPADVDEVSGDDPGHAACENARRKAEAVAGARVLGADTVVALEGAILSKPAGEPEAREWLRALSGRDHTVFGGLCVIEGARRGAACVCTRVRFRELSATEVEWYLATGEWRGRAGGYAIQGRGGALVAEIEGDYLNIVGLSAVALLSLVPDLLVAVPPEP
ncbi:MAG: Maf family protein [Actinomycetota bacterium]|nr:Maf family protein [Actinomycetota bacterium]